MLALMRTFQGIENDAAPLGRTLHMFISNSLLPPGWLAANLETPNGCNMHGPSVVLGHWSKELHQNHFLLYLGIQNS